jgi:hypothetical protein
VCSVGGWVSSREIVVGSVLVVRLSNKIQYYGSIEKWFGVRVPRWKNATWR